jgi:hypothetical protein
MPLEATIFTDPDQYPAPAIPNSLNTLPGFPFVAWTNQTSVYQTLNRWYFGQVLNETTYDQASKQNIDKYPLHINPLKKTCERHASVLMGTSLDSIHYGGLPVTPMPRPKKKNKKLADEIKAALLDTWEQSGGGAMFLTNALISQRLGGCVFQAGWDNERKYIRITNPAPHEFIGIPDGSDLWNLREAWIVKVVSYIQALSYGVATADQNAYHYYVEHWTRKEYEITIDGEPIKVEGYDAKGENTFGFVPIVYIPHLRVGTNLLGRPIINESVQGIILELNLRWADLGDAVNDDAHAITAVRNVRGGLSTLKVGDWHPFVNLGSQTGLGNEGNPDMITVKTSSASAPMITVGEKLWSLYRRETDHPAVADGEDEGSQRSSLTLVTRMWPLVSHVENERVFWSVGLNVFEKMLLKIMVAKELFGITQEHVDCPLTQKWATMLPKDRKEIVDETAIRSKNHLGTRAHLLEVLSDTADPEQEATDVLEEWKEESKILALARPAPTPFGGGDKGSGGDKPMQGKKMDNKMK